MRLYQILNEVTLADSNCPPGLADYINDTVDNIRKDKRTSALITQNFNPEALSRVIELWDYYKNSETFDWYGFLWWFVHANNDNSWNARKYVTHSSWPEIKEFYELAPTKWEKSKFGELPDIMHQMMAAPTQRALLAKAMGQKNPRYDLVVKDLSKYLKQVQIPAALSGVIDNLKIGNMIDAASYVRECELEMEFAQNKNDTEGYIANKEIVDLVDSVLKKHNLLHNFYGYEGYNKIKGSNDD